MTGKIKEILNEGKKKLRKSRKRKRIMKRRQKR